MLNYKTFAVSLDMKQPTAQRQEWEVVEGDNGNIIEITLTDDGSPVDLTGCKVLAVFGLPTGQTVEQDTDEGSVTISGTNHNIITIALKTGSFSPGRSSSGLMKCEIQVYSGELQDVLVTSAQFTFRCRRAIINGETVAATDDYPILVELIQQVQQLVEREQSNWSEEDPDDPTYIRNKPGNATGDTRGLVMLSSDVDSESETKAATPAAVKTAYDLAAEALRTMPSENLLDNWYFINPVNQRGLTTYPGAFGASYTIDRWMNGLTPVTVESGGLTLTVPAGQWGGIGQRCEKRKFAGMQMTASALMSDGSLITGTALIPDSGVADFILTSNYYFNYSNQDANYDHVGFQFRNVSCYTIVAVKLEVGDHQTLAIKDGSTWKLREIPSFYEQLTRCQFYFYRLKTKNSKEGIVVCHANGSMDASGPLPFPAMRAEPSITLGNTFKLRGDNNREVTSVTVNYVPYRQIATLDLHVGVNLTVGTRYTLASDDANATIDFSAEL